MHSSLIAFLAALGFIAFGYVSMLRLLSKQSFGAVGFKSVFNGIKSNQALSNLGSSAFFVSLPATSLLLFWGWGPALIWLVIFHLFIESICHLQYSSQDSNNNKSIADYLLRANNSKLALVEQGLIQAFFLASMGVVTALLATLIDRQSGLLFALLFLLPARTLLRHPSNALPMAVKAVGAAVILAIGLSFSDQLGFSIYGDWAPFGESVAWLRFNNPTVIAAVLTAAVFRLEKDSGFKKDLSAFAGLIIVLLTLAMMLQLGLTQPALDAPMNDAGASNEGLPSFMSLSLIIFAGFTALLIRLLNEEDNNASPGLEQFSRLQAGGLIHLGFMLLLTLSLGSALGIGAWKTHYVIWDSSLNLLEHLNLAISATLHLIGTQTESGTVMHTILLAALCFAGFSFMLNCAVQLNVEESDRESIYSLVIESKILQAILIFVLASYFISKGISIDAWLIIGLLGWILATHLIIGMSLAAPANLARTILSLVSISLIVVGLTQAAIISFTWITSAYYAYALCSLLLICVSVILWLPSTRQLIQNFGQNSNNDLF